MDYVEEFDKLKTKVLKYILFKKRTEQEVRQKFREDSGEMLDDVIEELKELNYINDENYIQRAVNEFKNLKNMSIKEIVFLFKATSWIFGSISNKNNVPKHEEIFTKKNTSRKYIGLISKYTVDLARVMCLINKGFKVCYIKYCDNGVTTENNVILAMKNK